MEIQLSKKKISLLIVGALVFVLLGAVAAIYPNRLVSVIFRSLELIRIVGIFSLVFFGVCLLFLIKHFINNKPGLIINEEGITDNTNATSVGLIKWNDITGIEKVQVLSSKILIILIDNPDDYIIRARNFISKKAMEANHKKYGSPISIISNSLKIDFEEMEELILREWENSKKV